MVVRRGCRCWFQIRRQSRRSKEPSPIYEANVKLLSLLALTVVAGAQTAPNWTEQSPQTSPSARIEHAMAYDSAHGQVVLFGGFNRTGFPNDTWLWDGSNWTEASPQTVPPGRDDSAMA